MMETSISRGLPRAMVDNVFSAPVHINAGGTLYTTTLDTLTRYPESKLAKLFDGTLPIPIDPINRQYFLDIDGSVFTHLLNFLRYGELLLPEDFTQLPLLTKLADHFQIQDMVQVLMNFISEEKTENKEENISKKQKKSRRNRNSFRKNKSCSGSNENLNQSLEPEKKDDVDVAENDNMKIGTCELGIVKLGVLQGAKVDLGTMESATIKSQMLETQMLTTKETQSEKLLAGNIESEALVAKSSKVEVLETGQMKCNTVEMNKVKTANVAMETIDAGLIKVEMLENNKLKTETVEMGAVSAASVEVKSLESETLKLKTLEVESLTANICTLMNKQESVNLCTASNTSDVVIIKVISNTQVHLCFFTTDNKIIGNIYDLKIGTLRTPGTLCYCDKLRDPHPFRRCRNREDSLYNCDILSDPRSFSHYYHCFVYSVSCETLYYGKNAYNGERLSQTFCQTGLMKVFQSLLKNGYTLSSSWIKDDNDGEREYVFASSNERWLKNHKTQ